MFQWREVLDAIHECAETSARLLKSEGRTAFKPDVPLEERRRNKACDVAALANVNANMQ